MLIDILVLKGTIAWESRQSQRASLRKSAVEIGPKAPKVALGNIRAYEVGHGSTSHHFRDSAPPCLSTSSASFSADLSPQHLL